MTIKEEVGLVFFQFREKIGEPSRADPNAHLVGRPSHATHPQAMTRKTTVEKRFEIPEQLHPFREGISEDDNAVLSLDLKRLSAQRSNKKIRREKGHEQIQETWSTGHGRQF